MYLALIVQIIQKAREVFQWGIVLLNDLGSILSCLPSQLSALNPKKTYWEKYRGKRLDQCFQHSFNMKRVSKQNKKSEIVR